MRIFRISRLVLLALILVFPMIRDVETGHGFRFSLAFWLAEMAFMLAFFLVNQFISRNKWDICPHCGERLNPADWERCSHCGKRLDG